MNRIRITKKLKKIVEEDETLVDNSSFFMEFKRKIHNQEVSVNELSRLIEKEPTLSAVLLKISNSGLYGQKKNIGSVKKAITIIGLKELESIITTNFVNNSFQVDQNENIDELWKHSLGVAITAKVIAQKVNPRIQEQIFSLGLLHDIGIFIMERYFKKEFFQIIEEIKKDPLRRRLVAEKKVLGLTHEKIGAFFVQHWNFPDFYIESIKHHHYIDQSLKHKTYSSIIFVADNIAKGMEFGKLENYYVNPIPKWIWRNLGINKGDFAEIIPRIQSQYNIIYAAINS